MEHGIKHEVHVHLDVNPAFYESLLEEMRSDIKKALCEGPPKEAGQLARDLIDLAKARFPS